MNLTSRLARNILMVSIKEVCIFKRILYADGFFQINQSSMNSMTHSLHSICSVVVNHFKGRKKENGTRNVMPCTLPSSLASLPQSIVPNPNASRPVLMSRVSALCLEYRRECLLCISPGCQLTAGGTNIAKFQVSGANAHPANHSCLLPVCGLENNSVYVFFANLTLLPYHRIQ